ncbi:metallophosphoesterase family protein [Salinisphaera hydrothermalis]|uniref:metallophosphoesterase family protein n=1 Tax=Salinisphaera hydrothermalis TaxID=563188 RepID=UPI00333EDB35
MRIVILADTHGFLDPRVVERVAGAPLIVHAGDVGTGIADELARLGDDLMIVAGNNDPDDCPWPASAERELPGGTLAVMHGHQWPAKQRHRRLRAEFPDARAVVCGHSHRRVLEIDDSPWLLNPGAAGKSRAYGGPGYIELTAEADRWRVEPVVFEPLSRRRR